MKQIYTIKRMLSAMLLLMMSALAWAEDDAISWDPGNAFVQTYDFAVDGIYYIRHPYIATEVIVVSGDNPYSGDIVIPSTVTNDTETFSVTIIADRVFAGCQSLTSITIPNSVTIIGDYAFAGCQSLTSVTIPNSVTIIGNYAFQGCSNLKEITIGNSVTGIGYCAFLDCPAISSIISLNPTPPAFGLTRADDVIHDNVIIDSDSYEEEPVFGYDDGYDGDDDSDDDWDITPVMDVFDTEIFMNATLYVPEGSKAAYSTAPEWNRFWNIQDGMPSAIEEIAAGEKNESNAPYYTTDGKQVDSPTQKGIYIKNGKKILVK